MASEVKPSNAEVKKWNKWIIVTAVALILVVASISGYLLWSRPWAHAYGTYDLETSYDYAPSDVSHVVFTGRVFNTGHKDGYATLHFKITDQRNFFVWGTIELGRVESDGGFLEVNKTFDWPKEFGTTLGAMDISDHPDNVLPLVLEASLSWSDAE